MKAVPSETPTGTKLVDVMTMNDDGEEFMRSRLVARDFRPRHGRPDRPDLFAAMPPLEAKKMPFIMTFAGGASEKRGTKDEQKMMFIDVRKAHFNGVVDDQEWVLVNLLLDYHAYSRFARIRLLLYGTSKSAIFLEKNYAEKLAAVGFKGSRAVQVELDKMRGLVKKWYDVKDSGIMRSGTWDVKEVVVVRRSLKFTQMGLEYTSDDRHRDAILEKLW